MKALWVLALLLSNDPHPRHHPPLKDMLDICIRAEVLDAREAKYRFQDEKFFEWDLRVCRENFRELWDAPLSHEVYFIVGCDTLRDMKEFNRMRREDLVQTQGLYPAFRDDLTVAIAEVDRTWRILDAMEDARRELYYITTRRRALKRLRDELVGPVGFYAGYVPPAVPWWCFTRY